MSRRRFKRIFLLGCPRSGTTLLQSIVAAHPMLTTFPETHFFASVAGRGRRDRWGLVDRQAGRVIDTLGAIEIDFTAPRILGTAMLDPRLSAWTHRFVDVLDSFADQRGVAGWIEKTPRHLRHVGHITRHVPDAEFVHLVRGGRATVASLVKVRADPSGVWGDFPGSDADLVQNSARRWAADLRLSYACVGTPGHTFVRYEDLLADPAGIAAALFDELALPLSLTDTLSLLARRGNGAAALAQPWESWKANVTSDVGRTPTAPGHPPVGQDDPAAREFGGTDDILNRIPFMRPVPTPLGRRDR